MNAAYLHLCKRGILCKWTFIKCINSWILLHYTVWYMPWTCQIFGFEMPLLLKGLRACVYLLESSFQSFIHLIQPLGLGNLWRRWLGREGEHPASSRGRLSCTRWGAEHREAPETHTNTHTHVRSFNATKCSTIILKRSLSSSFL